MDQPPIAARAAAARETGTSVDFSVAPPGPTRGAVFLPDAISRGATLLVTGEFDPLCPLEDAIEVYGDLTCRKEMWVVEDQFHPLWGLPNLGGLYCHDYVADWCARALIDGKTEKDGIAYVEVKGDGPFGDCEWTPPVGPNEAYF